MSLIKRTVPTPIVVTGVLFLAWLPFLAAQAQPATNESTLQALLIEVRLLRVTLEKSSLLVPRMELTFKRVQAQEVKVEALRQYLAMQKEGARQQFDDRDELTRANARVAATEIALGAAVKVLNGLNDDLTALERQLDLPPASPDKIKQ